MAYAAATNGNEERIRAIVFPDGDLWIAQCIEYDIVVQAMDVPSVLDKLQLTIDAEQTACGEQPMCERISPAPNYYHELWEKRSNSLTQHTVAAPIEITFMNVA